MHLRLIKLRGFKSFPDPVEVRLEPGVAVVVGPNGSGKSNVADAIVWAAGSLAPSELRAERPDDVLYGGGDGRGASDHCDVELVFDNADGGFGPELDFHEVSILRRLTRGGEGQYLVNRAPVRRTDLVELLADVGLGGSMHSIVSQGKVDTVLASTPEDRRHLVEEAAGLGKYKRRKHRAELKLARVQIEVDRARDVEDEVRKRLRPLALQATAAERAEKLAVEVAGLRVRVARLDLESLAGRRQAAEARRESAAADRRDAGSRLDAVLGDRECAEAELADTAGSRETQLAALYRLQGAGERIALRLESCAALIGRLGEDLVDAGRAAADRSDAAIQALEDAALRASGEARDAATASGLASERSRRASARLAANDRAVAREAEVRLDALRAEGQRVEAHLSEALSVETIATRAQLAVGAGRERLALRLETITALARDLAADHAEAAAAASRGGPSPAELETAANEARTLARAAATERDDVAERARATRERLEALTRSLAEREGIAPAARALAEAGERLALASLEPAPGMEQAVAAALAWRASAIIVANPARGLELLERARREGLGPLVVVSDGRPRVAAAEPPGATPLRSHARGAEDALRLLDDVWLVDSDRLLTISHGVGVTADGNGYDSERRELWSAGGTPEALLLGMEARRRALESEAAEFDARALAAAADADEAAAAAAAAETAFAAVAHLRGRLLDVDLLARLARHAGSASALVGHAADAAASLDAPLGARAAAAARSIATLRDETRRLTALEAVARVEASEAVRSAQAAEVVVARLGGVLEVLPVGDLPNRETLVAEASEALAAADAAARAAREAGDRARIADAALVARAPRRSALDVDLVRRLAGLADGLSAGLGRAGGAAALLEAPVRARADAGRVRASELGADLRRLGAEEVESRRGTNAATERLTAVEVEVARIEGEVAEAERRLAAGVEALDGAPEDVGPTAAEGVDVRAEIRDRIERLEARREALGKVNPLAREEHELEKARLDELAEQRADLERSLDELERLRDDLADTVRRRFDETFALVVENFGEVASTLFPGGEGRLRMVAADDTDGDADPGVEIELRPAGKRITRLSLLSGGEKALGAISFLFALFLARPCPFYLLDEVDAALDDANVQRFVDLLRRYADRAQFVVITHQKRTMEAADVLYGVTMGGDGVSEIVSRRLPREEPVAATA